MIASKPLPVDCAEDSDSDEEYDLETNGGGTARPNSAANNAGCNLSIDRNVVNEVNESAPGWGEERKPLSLTSTLKYVVVRVCK